MIRRCWCWINDIWILFLVWIFSISRLFQSWLGHDYLTFQPDNRAFSVIWDIFIPRAHTGTLLLCIRHLHPHESLHCTVMLTVTLTISALSARCFTCDVSASASKSSIRRFVITEKGAFSWLKAATTAFALRTLLRHYENGRWPHGLSTWKWARDAKVIRDGRFG